MSNARNTLYNDSYGLYRKVSNKSGLNFYLIPNLGDFNVEAINAQADDLQEEVLCFVDNDTFRYLYLDSSGNIKRGVISLNDINLVPPVDVNAADVRSKLIAELERRQHKFDLYPAFVENHPNAAKQIAKDTTRYRNMQMQFDELNGDIARCESVKRFADSVVANPEKQLHANSPVNAFVEVMSLADMQTFDANGEPYFRDEIVNCQTNTAREHDDRTRFGITGEVVTRGVYINPGEVKRSTYVTPGSNDQQPRIVIETSHAKAKKDGKPTVQITSRSAANLSEDEKNLLAFKMAKEMLLQYREGDKKHKIVLESKNPAHADQAARVYAALLMLTSADDAHQDRIKLNPSQIKVKVDGCDKPRFFTKSMDSKKQFYEKYFQDKSQIKAMRDEVTSVYRQKRQDIGADLKPDASEDTHSINVDNRQRITK